MKSLIIILITFSCISLLAQDTIRTGKHKGRKIRSYERTMVMNNIPEAVFAFMDDIQNTGMHMTKSSGAMMGSKLSVQWLSNYKTGLGTKYRWTGKVVGMKMDFTVEVFKWVAGKEKLWGTVGDAKMIVIDWFEMYLITTLSENGKTNARLGIYYTKHKGLWGFLLGKTYSKWCVKSMLKDTKKHFKD